MYQRSKIHAGFAHCLIQVVLFTFPVTSSLAQLLNISAPANGANTIYQLNESNAALNRIVPAISSEEPGDLSDETTDPNGNTTRDLNWELKFSASGKVFKDVSFADPDVGYIVTELGSVYKSTDGGESWDAVMNLGFPYYWYGVHALTPDTVFIAGFNNQASVFEGVVRYTYDGGNTWSDDIDLEVPVTGVGWLEKIHFFNADTGIVVNSFSGGCWITTTGGKDAAAWTYVTINADLGWIAGNVDAQASGNVYATGIHFANSTDFGFNWNSNAAADSIFDNGVDFLDSNNLYGWTGGGQISAPVSGWIRRTTNGGESWSARLNNFPYPIRAVKFFSENFGIATGGNLYEETGGIYSTKDGGLNWDLDISTAAEMMSIDFQKISTDSMDVWCVGSTGGATGFKGVLYKTRIGDAATGSTGNIAGAMPLTLAQNAPNPFSNATEIKFSIPEACSVSIRLYDVYGREVSTILNDHKEPGHYSVTADGASLAAGIYFYRFIAGTHMETLSMTVIK
ncbi:MAG TPA: T9SS type A sorting domain-containing protein [Chitinophagales bacterium]|nr:T9SS type A sorting domain-containing protein [Chitinophagales bacterium]